MLVTRNILFKFMATYSHINKGFPVQSENSTEWKSALKLISSYGGSYLNGASCTPLQSITKMFCPMIRFGNVLTDLITKWGGNQTSKTNWNQNELHNNHEKSMSLSLQ